MAGFFYRLLDRIGIKNYSSKTFIIFVFILLFSLLISEFVFLLYNIEKEKEFIAQGLKNASKIRASFIKSRMFKLSLDNRENNVNINEILSSPHIEGLYYRGNIYGTFPKCSDYKKYVYTYCGQRGFIVKIRDDFYIFVKHSFIEDILDPKKGMISIYNPVFKINSNLDNKHFLCKGYRIPESNITIYGCVSKTSIFTQILKGSLIEGFLFFSIFLLIGFLSLRLANGVIIYPIKVLKNKIRYAKNRGINTVDFKLDLHDEFGELSSLLEEMKSSIEKYQNQLNLIIETTSKMISLSNDTEKFIRFTINRIEDIFPNSKGNAVFLVKKSHTNKKIKIFSNHFKKNMLDEGEIDSIFNSLEINSYSLHRSTIGNVLAIRKRIDDIEEIRYLYISEKRITDIEIKYINIILSHLIYSINLTYIAHYDSLTSIFNRRAIFKFGERMVNECLEKGIDFSLLIIDIDDFKAINDTYGHFTGDELLRLFADFLIENIKNGGVVGRLGGEEFVVLLKDINHAYAIALAEELKKKIEDSVFYIQDFHITITASFGVASLYEHGNTFGELMKAADVSLYKAKKTGKNRVVSLDIESVNSILYREFRSKIELEEAIKSNRVVPFFQPIYSLKDFSVIGYEVLARIKINGSYISAYQFITDMIRFGLTEKLDRIVQEKALKHVSEEKIGNKLIFFNLSKAFIHRKENFNRFLEMCDEYNIDTSQIVFEITEEEAITDIDTIKSIIKKARERNIKIAIDDFGAGYSTFSYIKDFDVDFIKIDGSLIKGIHSDKDKQIIIEGITLISKKKKIKTIAEMVENEDDMYTAKFLGVDYVQGYLLSKPLEKLTA